MPKEKKSASTKAKETTPLKRFFFPNVHNGVTIEAASLEEAQEKAKAMMPAEPKSESKETNE